MYIVTVKIQIRLRLCYIFFSACGGQIVNGDKVTVKIKLRVCYNYFSPPAAGKLCT